MSLGNFSSFCHSRVQIGSLKLENRNKYEWTFKKKSGSLNLSNNRVNQNERKGTLFFLAIFLPSWQVPSPPLDCWTSLQPAESLPPSVRLALLGHQGTLCTANLLLSCAALANRTNHHKAVILWCMFIKFYTHEWSNKWVLRWNPHPTHTCKNEPCHVGRLRRVAFFFRRRKKVLSPLYGFWTTS